VVEAASLAVTGEVGDWRYVSSPRQKIIKCSYVLKSAAANTNAFALVAGCAVAETFTFPVRGYVVGVEAQYSSTISAGTAQIQVVINALGTAVVAAQISATGTYPAQANRSILSAICEVGDLLYAEVETSVGFAATGGEFTVDVYVALGDP
jgi:hypothetical protein